jgi:hypothetical protein
MKRRSGHGKSECHGGLFWWWLWRGSDRETMKWSSIHVDDIPRAGGFGRAGIGSGGGIGRGTRGGVPGGVWRGMANRARRLAANPVAVGKQRIARCQRSPVAGAAGGSSAGLCSPPLRCCSRGLGGRAREERVRLEGTIGPRVLGREHPRHQQAHWMERGAVLGLAIDAFRWRVDWDRGRGRGRVLLWVVWPIVYGP